MDELKIKAFCEYFNCADEDDIEIKYNNCLEYEGGEWLVLTNEEARDAVQEYWEEYLEEMLHWSDVPEWAYPYFNKELWIEDQELGDRGPALSSYNGEEVEISTLTENGNLVYFYMYQQ